MQSDFQKLIIQHFSLLSTVKWLLYLKRLQVKNSLGGFSLKEVTQTYAVDFRF